MAIMNASKKMSLTGFNMQHCFATLLALSGLTIQITSAQVWTRIGGCVRDPTTQQVTYDMEKATPYLLQQNSQNSQRVKICTVNSNTDCVTSKPNSFPILNFNQGIRNIANVGRNVPCGPSCVKDNWVGPQRRLDTLRTLCIGGASSFYHACGNQNGLHFGPGRCRWVFSDPTSTPGLDIFIDVHTAAPTKSPTAAPTWWYQTDGHKANISEIQDRMTKAEATIKQMSETISTLANQTYLDKQLMMVQNNFSLIDSEVKVLDQTVAANFSTITAVLQSFKDATAKVTTGNTPPSDVTIEAIGSNVVIGAPASISVTSNDCSVDDLCEISAFASRLSEALQALP